MCLLLLILDVPDVPSFNPSLRGSAFFCVDLLSMEGGPLPCWEDHKSNCAEKRDLEVHRMCAALVRQMSGVQKS